MFELLIFLFSLLGVAGFIMPLVVSWLSVSHLKMDNIGILAIVMGSLIAFFL